MVLLMKLGANVRRTDVPHPQSEPPETSPTWGGSGCHDCCHPATAGERCAEARHPRQNMQGRPLTKTSTSAPFVRQVGLRSVTCAVGVSTEA